jgi:LuxR family transcriptional regulator, maltose regulon positive regulatory protein
MKLSEHPPSFHGIIATKIRPPQMRTGIVHRQRLFDKINARPAKLILVAAPAGFGKSTVVLDYLKQNNEVFAWLSLDESDNDLKRFFQYFLSALRIVNPSFGEKIIPALKGTTAPSAEVVITAIVNEIHRYNGSMTFVLDDYYFIEEQDIHNAVNFLLDHLPPNLRLVISTRVDPLLPLHRMRVRGELIEIRERDLRFTYTEADDFFETMNIHLSGDDLRRLSARTEGWIAGLQLAAISLHDVHDVTKFIDSFAGTNRYVLDYLLAEVLNKQTKEVQMFLLQTSILTRFNEELCNSITGGMNARKILDYLERSNIFLIPLDESREWFRYHHLFSELLQYRLRQLYPGLIDELYHNASVWYEERKNISEAINYALRVKNFHRAAHLLNVYGIHFLSRSELTTIINYERKIPASISNQFPQLLVVKAWALMLMHRTESIDSILKMAEDLLQDDSSGLPPEQISFVKWNIDTIRAFILRLRGNLSESLSASYEVLRSLPPDSAMIGGLLKFNIGRIYMKQGYAGNAIEIFEQAFEDNLRAKNYYVLLAILGHTGYLYSITDSIPTARRKLEDALVYAEENELDMLPAAGYICYQLGRVLYHQNELDRALEILNRAVRLGEMGNEPDIRCNALIISSWIHALRGDRAEACEAFSRVEEIERNTLISVYEADILHERAGLAFLLNDFDRVKSWMDAHGSPLPDAFSVIDENRYLIMINYLVQSGAHKKALGMIRELRTKADERCRLHTIMLLDIIESVSLWRSGEGNKVLHLLNRGLERASEMGYLRMLLNIGEPLSSMLSALIRDKSISPVARGFASELLHQFPGISAPDIPTLAKYKQELVDPLTEREQEVLYYISQNLSNRDISNKLFISLDTVKTHLKHIYGKLDVNKRTDAVRKARELNLL